MKDYDGFIIQKIDVDIKNDFTKLYVNNVLWYGHTILLWLA